MTTDQHPPKSFFEKLKSAPTMRPKWRFWLDHVLVGAAIVLVAVGLVYLGSFVTYLWRSSHISALPTFGREGYGVFFRVFPWWHGLFVLIGIAAFFYLLRRHTHLYRWPLAVTLGVFFLAFIAAAVITDTTRVHDRLTNRSIAGMPVPLIGPLYRGQAGLAQGVVTAATVTKVNGNSVTVTTGEETLTVKITDETRLPPVWDPAKGDEIVIIGKRDGSTITAYGIHPADELPDRRPFRMHRGIIQPPPDAY